MNVWHELNDVGRGLGDFLMQRTRNASSVAIRVPDTKGSEVDRILSSSCGGGREVILEVEGR
jgi:hypothetical protein